MERTVKTYKVAEILEATGMNRNQFAYCRRKIGIEARHRGSASEYTRREFERIASAFHSLFPVRDVDPANVAELKQIMKNNGY
jgi:copper homeostasis protein CutC